MYRALPFGDALSILQKKAMKAPKLLIPFLGGMILALGACSKVTSPTPLPIIHAAEQDPFKQYLDSSLAIKNPQISLTIQAAPINFGFSNVDVVYGQALIGYAFRTSAPVSVTSLGVLLPATGYRHTVALWDSATGHVLVEADVTSLDSGRWTYQSLTLNGQPVDISPGKGYVVGFNSLANGSALLTTSPGNEIYWLNGILDLLPAGDKLRPIFPFTKGLITYEGFWQTNYFSPITTKSLPFPGGTTAAINAQIIPGVCDIGYVPQ